MTHACENGWICEAHPDRPSSHDDCPGAAMLCDAKGCPHLGLSPHEVYDVIRAALLSATSGAPDRAQIAVALALLVPPRPWR